MAESFALQTMKPNDVLTYCGAVFYQRGHQYAKAGRVSDIHADRLDPHIIRAQVQGRDLYDVSLFYGIDGRFMSSHCDCPAFPRHGVCKHIAAALIELAQPSPSPKKPSIDPLPPKSRSTQQFFRVFASRHPVAQAPASKELLQVQFLIGTDVLRQQPIITVEMRIGTSQKLYIIPKLAQFLEEVRQGKPHSFSKRFTYDPEVHEFSVPDRQILEALSQTLDQHAYYLNMNTSYGFRGSRYFSERTLDIPPLIWDQILPVLPQVTALWSARMTPLCFTEDPLPLSFAIDPLEDTGYVLSYDKPSVILCPQYGVAIMDSTVFGLPRHDADLVYQLLQISSPSSRVRVPLNEEEMEQLVSSVLPQLENLGTLKLAPKIASQITTEPLEPRIYLDWLGEQIQAEIHFVYGTAVIVYGEMTQEPSSQIIRRDAPGEAQVIQRVQQAGFIPKEGRFVLTDEEAIYQFVQVTLKEWATWADIRVTDAFSPVHHLPSVPKVRMELDSGRSWLDVSFDMGDLEEEEIIAVLRALKEKRRYYRLTDGRFLSLEDPDFQAARQIIEQIDIRPAQIAKSEFTLPAIHALSLVDPHPSDESRWQLGKSLRRWLDDLRHPDNLDINPPSSLQATLRDYQQAGFLWMTMLSQYRFGGILADDMGLGKTIQSIAFLLAERESGNWTEPALVIAPASLIYNWHREFEVFAPKLKTQVIAGEPDERQQHLARKADHTMDVFITSYPLLRRDLAYYRKHSFYAIIFDEAQTLKNAGTQVAQAAQQLKSARRFALTGTPLENSVGDLWSIFRVVFPELLGSRQKFSQMAPVVIAKRVRPFILRRLKSDVLKDLPDKIESVKTTELTREQKSVYLAYLEKVQADTQKDLAQAGFQKSRIKILTALTRLRQICCHPGLFVDNYRGSSAKLDLLLELVEEALASGRHLLIFSQFTSMLSLIAQAFDERAWPYFSLDGDTPVEERLNLVNRFNDGERSLFLISLKAGGTGLNLTGADTVILYDLWWNPAVESQATDRAHRIGQRKVVQVIRLVTQGTIEEKIYVLQEKKRNLIDQVINTQGQDVPVITEDDIREILQLS